MVKLFLSHWRSYLTFNPFGDLSKGLGQIVIYYFKIFQFLLGFILMKNAFKIYLNIFLSIPFGIYQAQRFKNEKIEI